MGMIIDSVIPFETTLLKHDQSKLLNLPVQRISESRTEIKINLNFYFHTSLWRIKRF